MEPVETFEVEGLVVKLYSDDTVDDPRKWYDHVGRMICDHGRYQLGDTTLADEIGYSPESFNRGIPQVARYLRLFHDAAIVLPLWLYDHGGISMGVGSPRDLWDSGYVGVIYCTRADVEKEWGGDLEAAERYLRSEVEEYDQFLTGDVYGYVVETPEGDHLDSLWGLYGSDYAEEQARAAAEEIAKSDAEAEEWAAREGIPTIREELV